ncbi:MAG: sugar kinase, partial [Rhodoglobus sp.]|nr:sugar kinase [Rhodoglobus sp.]
ALPALREGVRDVLFDGSLPEAARRVDLLPSSAGDNAGVIGASVLAREQALSADGGDALLAR